MSYRIKVLDPAFKKKVDEMVAIEVEAGLKSKHIPTDKESFARQFEIRLVWDSYYAMWNDPGAFPDNVREYYQEMGLWTPIFSEMTVDSAEEGFQTKARIVWNGKKTKIDDIQEIFCFERI